MPASVRLGHGAREPLKLDLTRAGRDALDDGPVDTRVRASVMHPNGHVTRIVDAVRLSGG